MKPNSCHITVLLDRSGSMDSAQEATIEGFNGFIRKQQEVPGTATFTLVQFDDQYEVWQKGVSLNDAQLLTSETYVPRGSTALIDAICRAIDETGEYLDGLPEDQKPERVIFVIQTDGFENASTKYNMVDASTRIQHQQSKYQWMFTFLGANQDAIASAAQYGIDAKQALSYRSDKTSQVIGVLCSAITDARLCESTTGWNLRGYTEDQRATCQ